MKEINVFESLFENLYEERQKKIIFNFDEFETSVFYIYYYEKINSKYFLDNENPLTRLILIFGFLFFCINNKLQDLEIKTLKILDLFYSNLENSDDIEEWPLKGMFKKSLIKIYEYYYNLYDEKISLELKKLDFEHTLYLEADYYYNFVLPEHTKFQKNDLILNIGEFLSDVLEKSFVEKINDLWDYKIMSNSERNDLIANNQYDKAIDWILFYIKQDNDSKIFSQEKLDYLLRNIEVVLKNPTEFKIETEEDDLPF